MALGWEEAMMAHTVASPMRSKRPANPSSRSRLAR